MALTHPLMFVAHTHITFFTLHSHLLPYPPILFYLCRTLCSIFYLLYNTPSSTWSLTNYLTSVVILIEAYISPNWKTTLSYKKKMQYLSFGIWVTSLIMVASPSMYLQIPSCHVSKQHNYISLFKFITFLLFTHQLMNI